MGQKATITKRTIEDAWRLHQNGWTDALIADTLKCSTTTVLRCWKAMELAFNGRKVPYNGLWRDSHHIADYANNAFDIDKSSSVDKKYSKTSDNQIKKGNVTNPSEIIKLEKDAHILDSLKDVIKELSTNIATQNALLEKFIKKMEYKD